MNTLTGTAAGIKMLYCGLRKVFFLACNLVGNSSQHDYKHHCKPKFGSHVKSSQINEMT